MVGGNSAGSPPFATSLNKSQLFLDQSQPAGSSMSWYVLTRRGALGRVRVQTSFCNGLLLDWSADTSTIPKAGFSNRPAAKAKIARKSRWPQPRPPKSRQDKSKLVVSNRSLAKAKIARKSRWPQPRPPKSRQDKSTPKVVA